MRVRMEMRKKSSPYRPSNPQTQILQKVSYLTTAPEVHACCKRKQSPVSQVNHTGDRKNSSNKQERLRRL